MASKLISVRTYQDILGFSRQKGIMCWLYVFLLVSEISAPYIPWPLARKTHIPFANACGMFPCTNACGKNEPFANYAQARSANLENNMQSFPNMSESGAFYHLLKCYIFRFYFFKMALISHKINFQAHLNRSLFYWSKIDCIEYLQMIWDIFKREV